jgi:hypothetical protein
MTRTVGTSIISAPCCGSLYRTTRYSSINYSAWEHWTDGYSDSVLAPSDEGLSLCQCGQYFLHWQCVPLFHISKDSPKEEQREEIPYVPTVGDRDLQAFIDSDCQHKLMSELGRRRYWRHLNDDFRKHYRDCMAKGQPALIQFNPSEAQLTNMQALLELLQKKPEPNWLELAELHHELGNQAQALACLDQVGPHGQKLARAMRKCFDDGLPGPFRYRPDLCPEPVLPPSVLAQIAERECQRRPWRVKALERVKAGATALRARLGN